LAARVEFFPRNHFGTRQKLIRERGLFGGFALAGASSRTPVTIYSGCVRYRFYESIARTIAPMLPGNRSARNDLWVGIVFLLACILGSALILSADTPGELRAAAVGTCYCHCAEASAHKACVKMCESPKYTPRLWAATCAKPRMKLPVENRDAGPRFEHPGRNERAQAAKPAAGS
jgi:hypothetical protein